MIISKKNKFYYVSKILRLDHSSFSELFQKTFIIILRFCSLKSKISIANKYRYYNHNFITAKISRTTVFRGTKTDSFPLLAEFNFSNQLFRSQNKYISYIRVACDKYL